MNITDDIATRVTLIVSVSPNLGLEGMRISQKQIPLPPPEETIDINDVVDETSLGSFPASDPPSSW